MKQPTNERRDYSIRVTRKRTDRALRRRIHGGRTGVDPVHAPPEPRSVRPPSRWANATDRLVAPKVFGLVEPEDRLELTDFLRRVRELGTEPGRKLVIDFSSTERMQVHGTLLLAAELGRINTLRDEKPVSCLPAAQAVVAQVLQHVGIYDMLSHQDSIAISDDTVRHWKIHSGQTADGERASKAIEGYEKHFSSADQKGLYRALTEAMTNCRHHAYPDGAEQVRNWWMFSQPKDDRLTVALCDLGVGIPSSLRTNRSGRLAAIARWLARVGRLGTDGNLLAGAMAVGKTRTKQAHRGKGLLDIRRGVEGLSGSFHIYSGRGFYLYDAAKRKRGGAVTFEAEMNVKGTLLVWTLPLTPEGAAA